jgi:hypothetical protein
MRTLLLTSFGLVIVIVACGGSTASIPNNAGGSAQLLKQTSGAPTGNGSTCSWEGTSAAATMNAPPPTYAVGDQFKSLDGCNDCSCTSQGISCTDKACGGTSSSSGNTSSSSGAQGCTTEAKICPDGHTTVGRTGPNCEFAPCPVGPPSDGGTACPDIARQCPDGSFVSPSGPNCTFPDCPQLTCDQMTTKSEAEVDAVLQKYSACNTADDCTTVAYATNCFSKCSRSIGKLGLDTYNQTVNDINNGLCKAFKADGCKFPLPPCVAPQPPQCNNHVCQ